MPIFFGTSTATDCETCVRVIGELPKLMDTARVRLGLTVVTQARQVGVAGTTLTRLYSGGEPTQGTILACLRWLAAH